MAKELPYFRFYATEWMQGDVTLLSMEHQGIFINVCSFYWLRDGELTFKKLSQKWPNYLHQINDLIEEGVMNCEDDTVTISFLDEQLTALNERHKTLSEAGRKGGLSRAKAKLKPSSSYKDKEKDNNKDKDNNRERKIFKQPTLEEVKIYCKERNRGVNAVKWFNHYTSNGWKVGKNSMKNWKAAVHTWEESDISTPGKLPESKGSNLGGSKMAKDYGVPSPTAVPMPEGFKKRLDNIGK